MAAPSQDAGPVRSQPVSAARVVCCAFLCSGGCYLPDSAFSGVVMGLFPGLAFGSGRRVLAGAYWGLVVDLVVTVAWLGIGGFWEPRFGGYNSLLEHYLPPSNFTMTHMHQRLPNSLIFGVGLTVWMTAMFAVWIMLWEPRIHWPRRLGILALGATAVGVSAIGLWNLAPLKFPSPGNPAPWTLLIPLGCSMPACAVLVGLLIRVADNTPAADSR